MRGDETAYFQTQRNSVILTSSTLPKHACSQPCQAPAPSHLGPGNPMGEQNKKTMCSMEGEANPSSCLWKGSEGRVNRSGIRKKKRY